MRAWLAALAVAALCAAAVPAQAKPRRDCLRSGTTVMANARARLFYVGLTGDYQLYVCWVPARRVRELGALSLGETGPAIPVLAGEWVAYDRLACDDPDACFGRVAVRSARTGKRLRLAPPQPGRASALVLTERGAAAWIRDKVYALGPDGLRTLDDAGPPVVDPDSLALAGTRAYWFHAGAPVTAEL